MLKQKEQKIEFKFWLPAIIWMGLIFYFSQEPSLTIGLEGDREFIIRKFAHICEFGILAILFIVLLARGCNKKSPLIFLGAFLLTVGYALSDELHQTFVAGRSGNIQDVLVDSLGALLFLQIAAFTLFIKKRVILFFSIVGNILAMIFLLSMMMQTIIENRESLNNKDNTNSEIKETLVISKEEQIVSEKVNSKKIETQETTIIKQKNDENNSLTNQQQEIIIPERILLNVPFSSQAPNAVWDEFHEEACEEMSLIMVKYYFDKKNLTSQVAEEELQKFKDYQLKKNGHYVDSDMEELATMAVEYFNFKDIFVKEDLTKQDILEYLTQGSPIIVPTAGRLLGNPNFSGLGPLYHNLVIIGFENDDFIVNDPGTRKGEKYRYKMDVLMNAIHDFPGNKKEIEKGLKIGIIFPIKS